MCITCEDIYNSGPFNVCKSVPSDISVYHLGFGIDAMKFQGMQKSELSTDLVVQVRHWVPPKASDIPVA